MTATRPSFLRVTLEKLWDTHTLDVPMNGFEATTLIAGVNGCGKTTLLRLVRALFQRQFYELLHVRFERLSIDMDIASISVFQSIKIMPLNDEGIKPDIAVNRPNAIRRYDVDRKLKLDEIPSEIKTYILDIEVVEKVNEDVTVKPKVSKHSLSVSIDQWAGEIERYTHDIRQLGFNHFENESGRRFNCEQLIDYFGDNDMVFKRTFDEHLPHWLMTILQKHSVQLIGSQRLIRKIKEDEDAINYRSRRWLRDVNESYKAVESCADDMRKRLRDFVRSFADKSQELDQSFAARVLDRTINHPVDQDRLRQEYDEIKRRQDHLAHIGLIQPANIPEFPDTRNLSEDEKRIIGVYVDDMKQKISIFDPLLGKADVFLKTLNDLLDEKTVKLDTSDSDRGGIAIYQSTKKPLRLSALSSGEQHLLVLFYDLIFSNGDQPQLVIIDEPEISLHIQWQYKFVDALERSAPLSNSQILIATHSPAIVNGRAIVALSKFEAIDDSNEESDQ